LKIARGWDRFYVDGRPFNLLLVLAFLLVPQAAWAEEQTRTRFGCPNSARPMARLELIFGTKSKRGPIGPRAFAQFLATEVTPRFPAGFTVFEGYGQWRGSSGRIGREPSRMLLIWYKPEARSDAKIEAIRAAYKRQFNQESVLRADAMSCVSI
jgi:hypothetical protein